MSAVVDDFIFGTLSTDALRSQYVRAQRAGVSHVQRRSPRDPRPGEPITLELSVGPGYSHEQAWVYYTTDGGDPAGRAGQAERGLAVPMEPDGVEWDTWLWGYRRRFRATLPGFPEGSLLRYFLAAGSADGAETPADEGRMFACYIADDPTPAWTREAVIYQIFVDRFSPGPGAAWKTPASLGGFFGGTLNGITENLEHIAALGANTLWLTPIFPSPSHHGYDAADLFTIEPRLGSKDDLQRLLDSAHQRSMRVLLDLVPNHLSHRHPAFQDAIRRADSPYREWFTFRSWPDAYETFFGVKELPQLNLRNPAARQHMLDAAVAWLELGVDGFRVDYAVGPAPDFWAELRRATRQARPDCWTFGEVVDPPEIQLNFEGGLDGCLDFVLLEAFRQTFAFGRWQAARFAAFLDRHEAYYPESFSRPSFLDNHDMNRFLWAAGGDQRRLRLAALCQFTLAGPPVIYYGTEVGLSQERDVRQGTRGIPEESRLPMLWGQAQDAALLDWYTRLLRLRKEHPALTSPQRQTLWLAAHPHPQALAYRRGAGEQAVIVVMNLSAQPCQVELPSEAGRMIFATGPDVQMAAPGKLALPGLGGAALGAG